MCNVCNGRKPIQPNRFTPKYNRVELCGWCGSIPDEMQVAADFTSSNAGSIEYIGYRCSDPDCPLHHRLMRVEEWNRRK